MDRFRQLKWFVENAFRTPDVGKRWLRQSVPALQGRMPISVLTEGDVDSVLGILATHASGAHI